MRQANEIIYYTWIIFWERIFKDRKQQFLRKAKNENVSIKLYKL